MGVRVRRERGGRASSTISNVILLTNTGPGPPVEHRATSSSGRSATAGSLRLLCLRRKPVLARRARSSQARSNWINARSPATSNDVPLTRSNFDVGHRIDLAASYHLISAARLQRDGVDVLQRPDRTSVFDQLQQHRRQRRRAVLQRPALHPARARRRHRRERHRTSTWWTSSSDGSLSERRGTIAERNCARQPFTNSLDFGPPSTCRSAAPREFTFDVLNILNLFERRIGPVEFLVPD